jgi:hypothetical protein
MSERLICCLMPIQFLVQWTCLSRISLEPAFVFGIDRCSVYTGWINKISCEVVTLLKGGFIQDSALILWKETSIFWCHNIIATIVSIAISKDSTIIPFYPYMTYKQQIKVKSYTGWINKISCEVVTLLKGGFIQDSALFRVLNKQTIS